MLEEGSEHGVETVLCGRGRGDVFMSPCHRSAFPFSRSTVEEGLGWVRDYHLFWDTLGTCFKLRNTF